MWKKLILAYILIKFVSSSQFNSSLYLNTLSYEAILKDKEFCSLPSTNENCEYSINKYTYHPKLRKCIPYQSCSKSKLEFIDEQYCNDFCETILNLNVHDKNVCETKTSQICEPQVTRFYFNDTLKQCIKTRQGSCSGPLNNFELEENCKKLCE